MPLATIPENEILRSAWMTSIHGQKQEEPEYEVSGMTKSTRSRRVRRNSEENGGKAGDLGAKNVFLFINQSRQEFGIRELEFSSELAEMAREHAFEMASKLSASHSVGNLRELQAKLNSLYVGENVQRGETTQQMHETAMTTNDTIRSNILSLKFTECGVGTARGSDGFTYSCHYFR